MKRVLQRYLGNHKHAEANWMDHLSSYLCNCDWRQMYCTVCYCLSMYFPFTLI